MVADDKLPAAFGWRAILLASLTNLVFKAVIAGMLGGRRMGLAVAAAWWPVAVVGALLMWLWPG
jgi:uncharacterized membrane protein (DUF4010 family)